MANSRFSISILLQRTCFILFCARSAISTSQGTPLVLLICVWRYQRQGHMFGSRAWHRWYLDSSITEPSLVLYEWISSINAFPSPEQLFVSGECGRFATWFYLFTLVGMLCLKKNLDEYGVSGSWVEDSNSLPFDPQQCQLYQRATVPGQYIGISQTIYHVSPFLAWERFFVAMKGLKWGFECFIRKITRRAFEVDHLNMDCVIESSRIFKSKIRARNF
jgi:hypothetical protein